MKRNEERCKVLGMAGSSAEARRYEAEIRILQLLNHAPGFPGYRHDGFTRSGERFVVYREVAGEPVRRLFEPDETNTYSGYTERLGWFDLTRRLLTRVSFLHEQKWPIYHGDISAGNVVISSDGDVGLIDFGISRSRSLPGKLRFSSHRSVAAPRYMTPEQARGRFWGSASDIYQVGLLALELKRREPLGQGLTVEELLDRLRTNPGYACQTAMRQPGLAGRFLPALLEPNPRCRPSARKVLAILDLLA
ncbi:MAG: protein kinase [Marinobacter sp.]|uniref:protein kinase domain-containing protein n=1 Tax=Marinobacter sp. TaxID=50741 RepID=UPI00349FFEED